MGLLDWIRSGNGAGGNTVAPESQQTPPLGFSKRTSVIDSLAFTERGNLIRPIAETQWHSDRTGTSEFRQHIGQSSEGYHGGFEVAPRGDHGAVYWSNARPTQEAAEKASHGMREAWHQGREPQWMNREDTRERFRGSSWER